MVAPMQAWGPAVVVSAAQRPRLYATDGILGEVSALARRLERSGADLWAANLRACLYAEGLAGTFADLGLELTRLRDSVTVRSLRLADTVDDLLRTIEHAVGPPDPVQLPLYGAIRDLTDQLRLGGPVSWVVLLEEAAEGNDGDGARVAAVLDAMAVTLLGEDVHARVEGLLRRLDRADAHALRCLPSALRAPVPA